MGNVIRKKKKVSIVDVMCNGLDKSLLPPKRLKEREALEKRYNRIMKWNEMVATKMVEEEEKELLLFVSSLFSKEVGDGDDQNDNFKTNLNTRLVVRLRRLIKEDFQVLNGNLLLGIGRCPEQFCSEGDFHILPGLYLYFAVGRDIQQHMLSPSSSITTVSELYQLPYPLLPELKVWIDSPDDCLQNSKGRIKLWRKALKMYIRFNRQEISRTYKIDL